MIPQPSRFVHGQALRPDVLNSILDTLRRQTPVAGPGIVLRHSPNGTIISAKGSAPLAPKPFKHPFQVTLEKREEGTIAKDPEIQAKALLWAEALNQEKYLQKIAALLTHS